MWLFHNCWIAISGRKPQKYPKTGEKKDTFLGSVTLCRGIVTFSFWLHVKLRFNIYTQCIT